MASFEVLSRDFYLPSARVVAPRLLGHLLLRRTGKTLSGGLIVETEAYMRDDAACHAVNGPTPRNQVMFGAPGHAYVYFIYGVHFCVNAVCEQEGVGEAVLIRAISVELGLKQMQRLRHVHEPGQLTNGPGKLCQALDIDRALNGADLCDARSRLFIARPANLEEAKRKLGPVTATTRIGIRKASELPLRFLLAGSPFVSRKVV